MNCFIGNWNVVLSVDAVLLMVCLAKVSYNLRRKSAFDTNNKKEIQKWQRKFDWTLPLVPKPESVTHSSLYLSYPPADYSHLPSTPYDMIIVCNKKPTETVLQNHTLYFFSNKLTFQLLSANVFQPQSNFSYKVKTIKRL